MSRASGDEKDKGGKALALSEVLSARRNAAALFSFQEGEHKAFRDVCLLEKKKVPAFREKMRAARTGFFKHQSVEVPYSFPVSVYCS